MTWWHKLALGTVPVVGVFACILLFQISAVVEKSGQDEVSIAGGVQKSLDTVNAECGVQVHCGTLAEIDKTLTHTSDLIVQTQLAVKHGDDLTKTEASILPQWNQQVTGTLSGINATVSQLDTSVLQVTQATVPVLRDTDSTVKHADALVSSPYVVDAARNLDASSAATASAAKHADATLGDIQFEADKIAHPSKKKLGFWGTILAGGDAARHFMPALF